MTSYQLSGPLNPAKQRLDMSGDGMLDSTEASLVSSQHLVIMGIMETMGITGVILVFLLG